MDDIFNEFGTVGFYAVPIFLWGKNGRLADFRMLYDVVSIAEMRRPRKIAEYQVVKG